MTLFAVINKAGLKWRFNTGNDTFVDIAFALFTAGSFDIDINEFLTINDGNSQLFLLSCIKQHAFHNTLLWGRASLRAALGDKLDTTWD